MAVKVSGKYDIQSDEDLTQMIYEIRAKANKRKAKGLPYKRMTITTKEWRKEKSRAQHQTFWKVASEIRLGFRELGSSPTLEWCGDLMKISAGYCDIVTLPSGKEEVQTRSIADLSEDVGCGVMREMIDEGLRYCSQELGRYVEI